METLMPYFVTSESSVKDTRAGATALDDTPENDLNRLNTYIQQRFFGDKKRQSRLLFKTEVAGSYDLQDTQTIWKAIPQLATFDQAAVNMPRCEVTTFVHLVRIRQFELAEIMADMILQKSKSKEKRKEEAQTLMALLKQLMETFCYNRKMDWLMRDDGMVDELKRMLTDVIKTGEMPEFKPPATVDKAYLDNNWPIIRKLYEEERDRPLSKADLNKVILMAARGRRWDVFIDCAQRGAELIKDVKDGMDTPCFACNCGTVDDTSEDAAAPKQSLINAKTEKTAGYSPLHEALRVGGFKLQDVEALFPDELVNATDGCGNTLLHVAVGDWKKEVLIDNMKFLMKHKADVNICNENDTTVIEYMVGQGDVKCNGNALAEIVMGADYISPHCWRPANSWSALHVLCSQGLHQYIVAFVEKGANQFELRNKLTLIDTLVLQDGLHCTVKEKVLTALLDERLSLGPFHAGVVRERPLHKENMVYRKQIQTGPQYLYPVERLLFPLVSTHRLRKVHLKLVQMLVDAGAVCDQELKALAPHLATLKEDGLPEAEEYLRTQIENL